MIPEQHAQTRLTQEAIVWQSGQEPFKADVVLWATGKITPNSGFLPASLLDIHGFVMVDQTLRLPGHPNVFAIGDIAASDPLRSSARNWGWRVVVANVKTQAKGGTQRLRRFRAPSYRWGSLFGFQDHGLTVVQPTGRRFRIPRFAARHLLSKGFIQRYLCGGLRPPS